MPLQKLHFGIAFTGHGSLFRKRGGRVSEVQALAEFLRNTRGCRPGVFSAERESVPMDGTGRKLNADRRQADRAFLVRFRNPASCLIASALCLSAVPLEGGDRPALIQRISHRLAIRSRADAQVPPAPDRPSSLKKAAPDSAESVQLEEKSDLPNAVQDTSHLHRFPQKSMNTSSAAPSIEDSFADSPESVTPIDLPIALRLAGFEAPDVLIAQQRVLASTARQQLAAAQALPNLNIGMNYDQHTGALQRASGSILKVQRSALYVGAGGNAVAAGTVNIPGLQYNLNVGEAYFGYLVSRQQQERATAAAVATRNNILLQVTTAYCDLVLAQGTRAIAIQARDDAADVARVTSSYAKIGQGRPADAERAATEVGRRDAEVLAADAAIMNASARLGQILNLESSLQLHSSENWIVPRSVVPDPIPLPELIAISLYQRPEVAERRAEVHAAMLELDGARLLLFSPQFIAGFSDGAFGGGGDVSSEANGSSRFGSFGNRSDADVVLYWSIRNLGLANKALIKNATARLAATDWEQTRQLNEIRAQVADAYARVQARSAQLDVRHRAVETSLNGFRLDLKRAHAGEGLPIEVLDSLRLLARSRQEYLETITAYNLAQYELYVAIGQPPADLLIHSAEPDESNDLLPEPE